MTLKTHKWRRKDVKGEQEKMERGRREAWGGWRRDGEGSGRKKDPSISSLAFSVTPIWGVYFSW